MCIFREWSILKSKILRKCAKSCNPSQWFSERIGRFYILDFEKLPSKSKFLTLWFVDNFAMRYAKGWKGHFWSMFKVVLSV